MSRVCLKPQQLSLAADSEKQEVKKLSQDTIQRDQPIDKEVAEDLAPRVVGVGVKRKEAGKIPEEGTIRTRRDSDSTTLEERQQMVADQEGMAFSEEE